MHHQGRGSILLPWIPYLPSTTPSVSERDRSTRQQRRLAELEGVDGDVIPGVYGAQTGHPAICFLVGGEVFLKRNMAGFGLGLAIAGNAGIDNTQGIKLLIYPNSHGVVFPLYDRYG